MHVCFNTGVLVYQPCKCVLLSKTPTDAFHGCFTKGVLFMCCFFYFYFLCGAGHCDSSACFCLICLCENNTHVHISLTSFHVQSSPVFSFFSFQGMRKTLESPSINTSLYERLIPAIQVPVKELLL